MERLRKASPRLFSLAILDSLVSLGEFLGVERTEGPEQGERAYALRDGVTPLASRIESKLEISLNAPNIGAPAGVKILGVGLITREAPEHLYCAVRALQIMDAHSGAADISCPRIVEIGAGFGGTALRMLQLRPQIESYRIIDLPSTNIFQGYYLSKAMGEENVSFWGEPEKRVHIGPTQAIETQNENFDLLFNENSMPEMPVESVRGYLSWAAPKCRIFYSYNQEAQTPASPQTLVPAEVRDLKVFKLLTRSRSWLRGGYVEEVWQSTAQKLQS